MASSNLLRQSSGGGLAPLNPPMATEWFIFTQSRLRSEIKLRCHGSKFTTSFTLKIRIHVTIGGCASVGGLSRMKLVKWSTD